MKPIVIVLFSIFLCQSSKGQDPLSILEGAYQKCRTVPSAYYDISMYYKLASGNERSTNYRGHFKEIGGDSLSNVAFHYDLYYDDNYVHSRIYTGQEFVFYNLSDSTGFVIENSKHPLEVWDWANDPVQRTPYIDTTFNPMPHGQYLRETASEYLLAGTDTINGYICYLVKRNKYSVDSDGLVYDSVKVESNYWINKVDSMPIQYTVAMEFYDGEAIEYQFERVVLNDYKINRLFKSKAFSLESIPDFINLSSYEPRQEPKRLVDSLAPDWNLPTTDMDSLRLSDLRGQLVLLDFFYKSCYPCRLAMPVLQRLHEKYSSRGLKVVGINPIDTMEDNVGEFMKDRGFDYAVVFASRELARQYRFHGYPTAFLINKEGKILLIHKGYSESMESDLEEVILDNL